MNRQDSQVRPTATAATLLKRFLPSALGILIFCVPIEIAGRRTTPLDHMVTVARALLGGRYRQARKRKRPGIPGRFGFFIDWRESFRLAMHR